MIKTYTIYNKVGDTVTIQDHGAAIIQWQTTVVNSQRNVLVSNHVKEPDFVAAKPLGAIVGPLAGIIDKQDVTIDNKPVKFHVNAESHTLIDSGANALDCCVWQVKEQQERAITFMYWLEDGFNGFPGPMTFNVEYRLAEDKSRLKIDFSVTSALPTILGPSSRLCFNLSESGSIYDHTLHLYDHKLKQYCGQTNKVSDDLFNTNVTSSIDSQIHAELCSPNKEIMLSVKSDYPSSYVNIETVDRDSNPNNGIIIQPCYNNPLEQAVFVPNKEQQTFRSKIIYSLNKNSKPIINT